MASSASFDRNVSLGRVFGRAFQTIAGNPVTMIGVAFVFGALPGVVTGYVSQVFRANRAQVFAFTPMLIGLGAMVLGLVFTLVTQGALVRATVAFSEGRIAGFGESAGAGLRKAVPLLGLAILLGLGVGIGAVFFLVPGIILYTMWAVAAPALVAEDRGVFGAFGRSRYLTKGARWTVFGLNLLILLIYWFASAALGILIVGAYGLTGMAAAMQAGLPVWYLLSNAVVQTILATVIAAIQTSLYVELRDWKDGPATEALSDIFA